MKNKNLLSLLLVFFSYATFAQTNHDNTKTISYFEKYIIEGNKPFDLDIVTKYEKDYRAIIWNESLIKDYKYSNEQLDKSGYEFVKKNEGDNSQSSKVYRNCSKGIVIEVTEWYGTKLTISMQWYETSVRRSIGYLMYCDSKKQTTAEINHDLAILFAEDKKKEAEKEREQEKKWEEMQNEMNREGQMQGHTQYFKKKKNKVIIYFGNIENDALKDTILSLAKSPELKANKTYSFDYTLYSNRIRTRFAIKDISTLKVFKGMLSPTNTVVVETK